MNDKENPLVSVVIPTYNYASYLSSALQSVLDQTYTNWEAIVIDNHSTDNTDEVMAGFSNPRITYLKIHNNGIIAKSRNAGIKAAKGEWVAFLDADDLWTPNKLEVCVGKINSNIDIIYHPLKIIGRELTPVEKSFKDRELKQPITLDLILNGNPISNSSVLVRKKIIDCIGGLDESQQIVGCEDYDAWLRISEISNGFFALKEVLGAYSAHQNNYSLRDTSLALESVVNRYSYVLSPFQKKRINSYKEYNNGRKLFVERRFVDSKRCLLYGIRYGDNEVKIKALYMLIYINIYTLCNDFLNRNKK